MKSVLKKYLLTSVMVSFFAVLIFSGCRKDKILTSGGELRFSVDTLKFDTVFTGRGNFTLSVKVYNPQSERVNISSVRLEKAPGTYFTINVNGEAGDVVNDVELAANDSMYVFATVNIDPTDTLTPFIVQDNLIATLNGRDYSIPFIAYGQNANYVVDSVINTNQTWKTDKPYVIMHNALVAENTTLTIPAGCRVYVHGDSRLLVQGTLKVQGTKQDSVVFQGDRLDRKYFGNEGYPGEWGGIYFFLTSKENQINYAILKNCGSSTRINDLTFTPAAIQLEPDTMGSGIAKLEIRNSIIENSIGYGILAVGSTVLAENCLINGCGASCFASIEGGGYYLYNCDFITYGNNKINHIDQPAVLMTNYRDLGGNQYNIAPLVCSMVNCVAWGSLETEFVVDTLTSSDGNNPFFNFALENSLVKNKDGIPSIVNAINSKVNEDPLFEDANAWNFKPTSGSPLIDAGKKPGANYQPPATDLNGKVRDPNSVDIGCYEY